MAELVFNGHVLCLGLNHLSIFWFLKNCITEVCITMYLRSKRRELVNIIMYKIGLDSVYFWNIFVTFAFVCGKGMTC